MKAASWRGTDTPIQARTAATPAPMANGSMKNPLVHHLADAEYDGHPQPQPTPQLAVIHRRHLRGDQTPPGTCWPLPRPDRSGYPPFPTPRNRVGSPVSLDEAVAAQRLIPVEEALMAEHSMAQRVGALVIAAVLVVGAFFVGRLATGFSLFGGEEFTEVSPAVVDSVRALAELTTVEMVEYTTVEKGNDSGWLNWATGDSIFLFAVAEIGAGVDLDRVYTESFSVDGESGRVTVELPSATIQYVSVDNEQTTVFDRDSGVFTDGDPQLESDARAVAEDVLVEAALEGGSSNRPTPTPARRSAGSSRASATPTSCSWRSRRRSAGHRGHEGRCRGLVRSAHGSRTGAPLGCRQGDTLPGVRGGGRRFGARSGGLAPNRPTLVTRATPPGAVPLSPPCALSAPLTACLSASARPTAWSAPLTACRITNSSPSATAARAIGHHRPVVEAAHVLADVPGLVEEVHPQLGMGGDHARQGSVHGLSLDREAPRAVDQLGEHPRDGDLDGGHQAAKAWTLSTRGNVAGSVAQVSPESVLQPTVPAEVP